MKDNQWNFKTFEELMKWARENDEAFKSLEAERNPEIVRWDGDGFGDMYDCDDGQWVLYSDHLAFIEALKAKHIEELKELGRREYSRGQSSTQPSWRD